MFAESIWGLHNSPYGNSNSAAYVRAPFALKLKKPLGPCAQNSQTLPHGLEIQEIQGIRVMRAEPKGAGNLGPFAHYKNIPLLGRGNPEILVNGTFHDRNGGIAAPIMRDGKLESVLSSGKPFARGGVAVLQSGKVVVCRPAEMKAPITEEIIQAVCAEPGDQVVDFLGGGAMLIGQGSMACNNGSPSGCDPSIDLAKAAPKGQQFDQAGAGLDSTQMAQAVSKYGHRNSSRSRLSHSKQAECTHDAKSIVRRWL